MYKFEKSDIRVDADVDDAITAPLTESKRSWYEPDTFTSESVYSTITLRAVPVVVFELCERCFDREHVQPRKCQVNWTREKDSALVACVA